MHANVCIHAQNITCPCGRIISYPRALIMGMASRRFAPLSLSISLSFSLLSIESYISRNFSNYVCMRRRRCLLVQMTSKPNAIRNSSARTRNHIARMQIECTHSRSHTHTRTRNARTERVDIQRVYQNALVAFSPPTPSATPHTHSRAEELVFARAADKPLGVNRFSPATAFVLFHTHAHEYAHKHWRLPDYRGPMLCCVRFTSRAFRLNVNCYGCRIFWSLA